MKWLGRTINDDLDKKIQPCKIVRRGSKIIRNRKSFLLQSLLIADTISHDVNNKIRNFGISQDAEAQFSRNIKILF